MTFSSEDSRCGRKGVESSSKTTSADRPDEHGNLFNNSQLFPDHNMAFSGHLRDGHGAETGLKSRAKTQSRSEGHLFAEREIPESFSQVSQPDPYLNRLLSDLLSQEEPEYLTQFSELESSFLPNVNALVAVGPDYEGSHALSLEEKRQNLKEDSTLCKRYHGTGTWRCASIALEGGPYCEKHYNDLKKRLVSKPKKTSGSVKSTEAREQSQKRKWNYGDSSDNADSKEKPKLNSSTGKLPRCVPPKQSSSWYDNAVHGPPRFSQLLTQASQSKSSQQPKATQTFDDGIRKYFRSDVPLDSAKSSETAITAKDENKGAILLIGETNLREQILEHMLASTQTRPSPNLSNNSKVRPNYSMTFRGPGTDHQKNDVKKKPEECRPPNFVESAMSESFSQSSRPDQHANLLSNSQIGPDQSMAFSSPDIRHGQTGVECSSKTKSGDRRPDQCTNLFKKNSQVFPDHNMEFSSRDFHRTETGVESGAKTKSGEGPAPIFPESQIPESFSQVSQPEEPEYLTQFSELESSFLPTVNALVAVRPCKGSHAVSLEEKPQQLEAYSTLCKWSHGKNWRCASMALEGRPYCEKHLDEIKKLGSQPEAKISQEAAIRLDSEQDSLPVNIDSPCPLWSEHPSLPSQGVQTKFSPTSLKKHPQSSNNIACSSQDIRCAERGVESGAKTKSGEGGLPILAESQIPESFSQVSLFNLSLNTVQLSQEEPECFTQFSEQANTILPTANALVAVWPYKGSQGVSLEEKPKQVEDGSTLCKICHGKGWRCAKCMALEGQPYGERYCNDVQEGVSKPSKTSYASLNFKSAVHTNEQSQKRKWSYGNSRDRNKDLKETPKSNANSNFVAEVEKVWDELQELSASDSLESEILGKLLEQSAGLRLSKCRSDNRQSSTNRMGTEQLSPEKMTEVPIFGNENEPMKISN